MRSLLVALVVLAAPAWAADDPVVGRWVLDEAAFEGIVEAHYAAEVLKVPPAQQEIARVAAREATAAAVAQMAGSAATFEADGTVVLVPAQGAPQEGTWVREGDQVRLESATHAREASVLIATFEDERLRLRADDAASVGFLLRRDGGS